MPTRSRRYESRSARIRSSPSVSPAVGDLDLGRGDGLELGPDVRQHVTERRRVLVGRLRRARPEAEPPGEPRDSGVDAVRRRRPARAAPPGHEREGPHDTEEQQRDDDEGPGTPRRRLGRACDRRTGRPPSLRARRWCPVRGCLKGVADGAVGRPAGWNWLYSWRGPRRSGRRLPSRSPGNRPRPRHARCCWRPLRRR